MIILKQFDIKGMSCAACSARVEKAVSALESVSSCSVNLLTNSMSVEGEATSEEIIASVEKAGYSATEKNCNNGKSQNNQKNIESNNEFKPIILRLGVSVLLLLFLMYLSMGHMLSLPLPRFLSQNSVLQAFFQLLISAVILIVNQRFFISGFKAILNKSPNMDTLVALGSGVSFVYSTVCVGIMIDNTVKGDIFTANMMLHGLYFESAAMILTLITVGKLLESYSKGKTTNAISALIRLAPKTATVLRNGKEVTVDADEMVAGDRFVVKSGGSISADGVVLEGSFACDQSALTGESLPIQKNVGDTVYAGTVSLSGYAVCSAQKVSGDTTLSQIIKTVEEASATKAPIARIADKVSAVFVPIVLVISAITLAVWLLLGKEIGFALARAISVVVISCPCALGLATPVAIMVSSGVGALNGILYKTAASIETMGKIKTVVFDKTGTLTKGTPQVTDVIPFNIDKNELLSLAASLETKSEHPLGKAVVSFVQNQNIPLVEARNVETVAGKGISCTCKGKKLVGGNLSLVENISEEIKGYAKDFAIEGKTPMYFSLENEVVGLIAVADVIKDDAFEAVCALNKMGIETVILTGDNEITANAIAKKAGIKKVVSDVLPIDKRETILKLQRDKKVAMVGDGINDAPALTEADVGIAIGAGVDIAIDSADVVLQNGNVSDVVTAVMLGRKALKNIKENLFWAFIYNLIGIPLAAGVFINAFGWELNPMFGAAAMSLSSFCVVTNALRLNFFKPFNKTNIKKEKKKMKIELKIEGMMCPHCSGRVKDALEKVSGVEMAQVSHETKNAVITLNEEVSSEALKQIVEDCGYKVTDIIE